MTAETAGPHIYIYISVADVEVVSVNRIVNGKKPCERKLLQKLEI